MAIMRGLCEGWDTTTFWEGRRQDRAQRAAGYRVPWGSRRTDKTEPFLVPPHRCTTFSKTRVPRWLCT